LEKYLDILLERAKMIENWRKHVDDILAAARRLLPDARVYVFGSVVIGEAVGGSDVDVLIVSAYLPRNKLERAKIKIEIERLASLPLHHPFELHLADKNEAQWYIERIGKEKLHEVSSK